MSDTSRSRLKVSREGIVLIKSFEGFRPRAVRGEDGRWTIGYGHTASAREGAVVGEQDAELLLQYDLMPVVKALNEQIAAPLNQHQFDALASFAISVGVDRFLSSDVLERLNEGHAGEAADALIGWPETAAPDSALRRRAAERALFVADPAMPVHLADLLAAPLPPPPVEAAAPEPEPASPADARAAAVASLLGETEETTSEITEAPANAGFTPAPSNGWAPQEPAFQAPASVHLQRYSPYANAIVGPLAGFPPAAPAPEAGPAPEPDAEAVVRDPAPPAPVVEALEPTPVTPMVSPPPQPSPFPPEDAPLVLTPASEADYAEARPVWAPEQRQSPPAGEDETVLFDDEPALSVLRHEAEPDQPRRFDWSETGAFLIMGGVGLAACGASAAAFRLASEQPSPMGETTVIAWALALIGGICVSVSGWNLYVRWGRSN